MSVCRNRFTNNSKTKVTFSTSVFSQAIWNTLGLTRGGGACSGVRPRVIDLTSLGIRALPVTLVST